MAGRKATDEQLIEALNNTRSTTAIAKRFNMSERAVSSRLRALGVPPLENWKKAQDAPLYRSSKTAGWTSTSRTARCWSGLTNTIGLASPRTRGARW